jgi:hypothetical protein
VGTDLASTFFALLCWLQTKLFADPTLDAMALAKDFCLGYYGMAGEDMYAYLCELEDLREGFPRFLGWDKYMREIFTPDNLCRWNASFDRMEGLVSGDERTLQHVRETRLSLDEMTFRCYARLHVARKDFTVTPGDIYARTTNTIAKALIRRGIKPADVATHAYVKSFEAKYLAAGASVSMKPKEFSHLPDDQVRQAFQIKHVTGARRKPQSDACLGTAAWNDKETLREARDFDVWLWDTTHHKTVTRIQIPNADLVHGRFHLYKIASNVPLAPEGYAVVGGDWHIMAVMDDLYVDDDERWDVYLSLKFEGEHYFPDRKGEANRVSFDRVVIVPPGSVSKKKGELK